MFCVTLGKTKTLKKVFPLVIIWVVSIIVIGWVWLFSHLFNMDMQIQMYAIAFIIAPVSEELLYRWLPVYLGNKLQQQTGLDIVVGLGVIANFIFIGIHTGNYPYAGIYWAFCVQGVLGFACLYLCRKYGVWASIALHIKYNVAIAFLL